MRSVYGLIIASSAIVLSGCTSSTYRPSVVSQYSTASEPQKESPLVEAIGNISDTLNEGGKEVKREGSKKLNDSLPSGIKVGEFKSTTPIKDITREPSSPGPAIFYKRSW